MSCNHQLVDDPMTLISQFHPDLCAQIAPSAQVVKPRRRRRKNNGEQSGISGIKKRKLSQEQITLLELNFGDEHKLESQRKDRLAAELGLEPRQVAVWFQNRRARYKCKKLAEEHSRLKAAHENAIIEKCLLESELMRLKDRLSEAEKGIQRLSERLDASGVMSSNSPIRSSVTVDAPHQPQFPGEYAYDDIYFVPNADYISGETKWVNFYV